MNYIDIFVIACAAIGLIFGLFGKFGKKLTKLLEVLAAVLVANFMAPKMAATALNTDSAGLESVLGSFAGEGIPLKTAFAGFLGDKLSKLNISGDSLLPVIEGLIQLFIFWSVAILLIIVFRVIFGIIFSIVFKKAKKHTAIKSLGLFGAVKGAVIALVLVFPFIVLSPLYSTAGDAIGMLSSSSSGDGSETVSMLLEEEEATQEESGDLSSVFKLLDDQFKNSKVCQFTNNIILKLKPACLSHEITEEQAEKGNTGFFVEDLGSLNTGLKSAIELADKLGLMSDEDVDPLKAMSEMSKEDIESLFTDIDNCPALKEAVTGLISDMLPAELGISADDIDLAAEGPAIASLVSSIEVDEGGNVQINVENIQTEDIIEAMSTSNLIEGFASGSEGLLSDMPEQQANEIKNGLQAKVTSGEIDQAKYDNLMKLFANGQPTE